MTSFIDLMKSDVWSEADIVNRTESMVRSEFPASAESILNRKIQGATLGQYTLSAGEMQELQRFATVTETARQAGDTARADMALLRGVLALEGYTLRLAQPLVRVQTLTQTDPMTEEVREAVANQPEVDADQAARLVAQTALAAASTEITAWVLLRNPPAPEVATEGLPAPEVQP